MTDPYRELDRKDPETWPTLWSIPENKDTFLIEARAFYTVYCPVLRLSDQTPTGRYNDIMLSPGLTIPEWYASFQAFSRIDDEKE